VTNISSLARIESNDPDQNGRLIEVDASATVSGGDADLNAGSGSGGISVIGPFTVDFDTPNVNEDYIELAGSEIAAGVIILRAWAVVTTNWTANQAGTAHQLYISMGAGTAALMSYRETTLQSVIAGHELQAAQTSLSDVNPYEIQIVGAGGAELYAEVYAEAGDFTAGALDIYALLYTPA